MLSISDVTNVAGRRVSRRTVLQVGSLALGPFSLSHLLRCRAETAPRSQSPGDMAVIHIFLGGGPSHIDTFDLKPAAPAEIRGEFRPIATCLPGVQISEYLPLLAQALDRVAIVRSAVAHSEASHLPASHWMVTGYRPAPGTTSNVNPYCGAVIAKVRGARAPVMPAYVSIPRRQVLGAAAYLGPAYNPFTTESDPNADDYAVRNLAIPGDIDAARLNDRQALLRGFDRLSADIDRSGEFRGLDKFSREALNIVTGDRARQAFDIRSEAAATRDLYGRTAAGQRCLLARRLVEAGVTFVTVLAGGEWDTHTNSFATLKDKSLPPFDRALAALVRDLHERGLDQNVLVLVSGEFGRTPKINPKAGRDHWPGAMSVLFAGGGLRMGQVVGATNGHGQHPATRSYSPGDVLATIYHVLGINTRQEFHDRSGRPLRVLPEGRPIPELLG